MLPSPACGRGAGGEGRRWHTDAPDFVESPGPHPNPLPRAGGSNQSVSGKAVVDASLNTREPT
ncbi:protein of unknown function [Cupriavidus taiwanensis]|nr:hypothetical protein CBM2606_A90331 [Cupriavidus taiwanensis]SPA41798.1 protein of unknown function [Cupriavidus taiwanensis]